MKTIENAPATNENKDNKMALKIKPATLHSRSLRPAKSMVRLRSLKPKRMEIGTPIKRRPIKAN